MRRAVVNLATVSLVAPLLAACQGASYFPPSLFEVIEPCPYPNGPDGAPVMDAFRSRWYSSHLRAAGEPRLGGAAPGHVAEDVGVLRFTWLRSFHASVMVRVEATADRGFRLTATELTGAGGYEPSFVARRVERDLSTDEMRRLTALLAETAVLNLPPSDDCQRERNASGEEVIVVRADGARWIIEANGVAGYRYVNRWSPEDGPVRDLGLHLIGLTGWTYDNVY